MFERKIFELAARSSGVFLAVASAVILGCGGGSAADTETTPTVKTAAPASPASSKGGAAAAKPAKPTRDVKPAALREFDGGLRALKLGGPEANERAAEAFERATAADPSLWE